MKLYAKYPFLDRSSAVLKEKGIGLDDLLTDIAYEPARTRGKERVAESVEKGFVEDNALGKETDQLIEILSYPIARMIVSSSGNRYLINRYALGEAMLLEHRLFGESIDTVIEIANELDVEVKQLRKELFVHFTTFLSATSTIRAKEWKLVNQEIFKGMVKVSEERLDRILRQRLYDEINSELPRPVNEKILSVFGDDAKRFSSQLEGKRKEFVAGELGPIDDSSFPPCMRTILTMMRNGENVPHTGRFAITSFLHTLGMNSEKIMEVFSTAPDFDPSKSEYQVKHISGEISGTEYTPPECSTMKSYGICYNPDNLCQQEWMTHPLKYYRAKKRKKGSRIAKSSPDPDKTLNGGDVRRDDENDKHDIEESDEQS